MPNRILFIRTFKDVGAGGSVPPLGLLYIISAIRLAYGDKYQIKLIDTGIIGNDLHVVQGQIKSFQPHIIGLSTIACEADLMFDIADTAKNINPDIIVLAGGPFPTAAPKEVLENKNIDYIIVGEGEETVVELLGRLEKKQKVSDVKGIAYIENGVFIRNEPREYFCDLDSLPLPAWGSIDFKVYSKIPNWNGNIKEKYYMPLLTSRGCPYNCIYCHNTLGKKFRARSGANVFSEIDFLYRHYNIREFHIYDDVFNFDAKRAKDICRRVIDSKLKLAFTFPNGLRADIVDDELIVLLRKAGVYKINYAVETVSPNVQKMIKKDLNSAIINDVVDKTNRRGIITTGYFMLGFPGETKEDMLKTISFAVGSSFDLAYFFKVTAFPGTELFYNTIDKQTTLSMADYCQKAYFYSKEYSVSSLSKEEVNKMLLLAQKDFYTKPKRILRILSKSPYKMKTVKNLCELWGKIILAHIETIMSEKKN